MKEVQKQTATKDAQLSPFIRRLAAGYVTSLITEVRGREIFNATTVGYAFQSNERAIGGPDTRDPARLTARVDRKLKRSISPVARHIVERIETLPDGRDTVVRLAAAGYVDLAAKSGGKLAGAAASDMRAEDMKLLNTVGRLSELMGEKQ